MRSLYMATVAACVRPTPTPPSCKRSSTLRSESGNRTYSITAKRMISGRVLTYLNGECFVICGFYKYTLLASTEFNLTVPTGVIAGLGGHGYVAAITAAYSQISHATTDYV